MLGYVGQPKLVRPCRSESAFDEVIVNRRASFESLALFLGEHRPDLLRAEPPDPTFTGFNSGIAKFVGDKPIPIRQIILINVVSSVDQVDINPLPLGARYFFHL